MRSNRHTGVTQRIRAALDAGLEFSTDIARHTGDPVHRVRAALSAMCSRTGGVFVAEMIDGRYARYKRFDPANPSLDAQAWLDRRVKPERPRPYRTAFVPLARDPLEMMRLSQAAAALGVR